MSCSAYAATKKPNLRYDFWQDEAGIKVQVCLFNHNSKKISWLLPRFVERNEHNKSFEIITNNKKYITPKYDYIDTNYKGDKTCIIYTLEEYKGWYNQYFQDISGDSFLIFGNHSLIIPESAFLDHKKIDVEFNWNNFKIQIDSNLDKKFSQNITSFTQQDFDSLYFSGGYEVLYTDKFKNNKWIYPIKYHAIIAKIVPKLEVLNNYLEKHLAFNNSRNSFIFVENNFKTQENPGTAYSNGHEFVQIVGINKEQTVDIEFIRTFIHEYLHKIIGHTIKFKNERYNKEWWFKEGFVDYLSCKILLETNIWSIEDYMSFYNSRIYTYFAFRMDKYKLNEMYDKYMYDEVGYIAGMLYASNLDEFIMNNTNGNKRLLDFLRDFLALFTGNENLYFSESLFYKSLKSFIKIPFPSIEELRDTNNLLNQQLLSGKLYLRNKEMLLPQYSYDFYELVSTMHFNNKKVVSIIPEPNESYSYHLELADENNKIEHFILKPLYITTIIPQYELGLQTKEKK